MREKTQTARSFIVLMAAVGLVFMNACTRSGGGGAPIEQAKAPVGAPGPDELDGQSGKSATEDKGAVKEADDDIDNIDVRNDDLKDSNGLEVVTYDPSGLKPEEIYKRSEAQGDAAIGGESRLRNGETGEKLFWSGSGQDSLRADLQKIVDTKTQTSHVEGDKKFAKSIERGSFGVDWSSRQATVAISVKKNGHTKTVVFAGNLNNKLLMRAGDLKSGLQMRIEAACMDLEGGCQTVYVKVQDGSRGVVDTAHLLLRTTKATIYTRASEGFGAAQNREFDYFASILNNTVQHSGEPGALNRVTLRTTEVINGKSSFKAELGLLTDRGISEALNIGGPLVKPAQGIEMSTPAEILRSTSPIADTIRNVSIVSNDGRGTMTLAVTIRKGSEAASEDNLYITLSRIHRAVRPLLARK